MTEEKADRTAEELSFGEALAELECIVASLEDGRLELEPSIAAYERGVGLLRACEAKLADAEQRVTVLMGELDAGEDDAERV